MYTHDDFHLNLGGLTTIEKKFVSNYSYLYAVIPLENNILALDIYNILGLLLKHRFIYLKILKAITRLKNLKVTNEENISFSPSFHMTLCLLFNFG